MGDLLKMDAEVILLDLNGVSTLISLLVNKDEIRLIRTRGCGMLARFLSGLILFQKRVEALLAT